MYTKWIIFVLYKYMLQTTAISLFLFMYLPVMDGTWQLKLIQETTTKNKTKQKTFLKSHKMKKLHFGKVLVTLFFFPSAKYFQNVTTCKRQQALTH